MAGALLNSILRHGNIFINVLINGIINIFINGILSSSVVISIDSVVRKGIKWLTSIVSQGLEHKMLASMDTARYTFSLCLRF
jgi:hypothetical protein